MSEFRPETDSVYVKRRWTFLIAVVLILALAFGVGTFVLGRQANSGSSQAEATVTPSISSAPFANFSARPTPSTDPSASASVSVAPSQSATVSVPATPSAATVSAAATASVAPTPSATATSAKPSSTALEACAASDLQVMVAPSKTVYAAGEQPSFRVTYTNTGSTPCTIAAESAPVDIQVTSGSARVYTKSICAPSSAPKGQLQPGAAQVGDYAWDRNINVLGCNALKPAQKGSYWVVASVQGVSSQRVNFVLQ